MQGTKNANGAMPAPIPANEAQRLQELQSYRVLDSLPEPVYEDLVFLVSFICETPIALISLIDEHRQWFKARVGIEAEEVPRDVAFCTHAILNQDQMLEVDDTHEDVRFNTNPFVVAEPNIRFYAGIPLVTPGGFALGTVCAIDTKPRALSAEQRRALAALGRAVMTQLELRRTALSLEAEVAALRGTRSESMRAASTPIEDRVRALLLRMRDLQRHPDNDGDGR